MFPEGGLPWKEHLFELEKEQGTELTLFIEQLTLFGNLVLYKNMKIATTIQYKEELILYI